MSQWNESSHDSPSNGEKEWFIVHTYSGFEKKVMDSLRERAEVEGIDGKVGEIAAIASSDTADRERLEGYAAHRWGLAALLPAGHAWKAAAP